jgi:hypothetical protein
MKAPKYLLSELIHDFDSESWAESALATLSLQELQVLAKLLSCPFSGVKHSVIVRLLTHSQLRFKLAPFTDDPLPLANAYRRESLRAMCKKAGMWRSGNKRQLAASLLSWRNQCRLNGQRFLAEMHAHAAARPRQLSFRF